VLLWATEQSVAGQMWPVDRHLPILAVH